MDALSFKPEKIGKTRRATKATVRYLRPGAGEDTFACTVPKDTPVALVFGQWLVADLSWLEPCLGAPPGQARTSMIYHGAKRHGVEVAAADVTPVELAELQRKPPRRSGGTTWVPDRSRRAAGRANP